MKIETAKKILNDYRNDTPLETSDEILKAASELADNFCNTCLCECTTWLTNK